MALEIERKFLVRGAFEHLVTRSTRLTQGYLTATPERTVRVRRAGAEAFLTIKGPLNATGMTRSEWEYPIPVADAEALLALCEPGIIDKTRHQVPCGPHTLEVDCFHGANEGLVLVEVELAHEQEPLTLPSWVGVEITGDPRYHNAMLARHPWRDWSSA
jgi:CYTH domain-containing protein